MKAQDQSEKYYKTNHDEGGIDQWAIKLNSKSEYSESGMNQKIEQFEENLRGKLARGKEGEDRDRDRKIREYDKTR